MERFRLRMAYLFLFMSLLYQSLDLCASLNDEGRALLRFREGVEVDPFGAFLDWVEDAVDPCAWFGVDCSDDGRVLALNLKDLCLKGRLSPELGKLIYMESLNLHNNSFSGTIPREIGGLQKLEILDLGHNDLSGPVPTDIGRSLSLRILVLRSNRFIDNIPPKLHELNLFSELQMDKELSSSDSIPITRNVEHANIRKLLQEVGKHKGEHHRHQSLSTEAPASVPSPSPTPSPALSNSHPSAPSPSPAGSSKSKSSLQSPRDDKLNRKDSPTITEHLKSGSSSSSQASQHKRTIHWTLYVAIGAGSIFFVASIAVYFLCCRSHKVVTVMPWRTGLSGQLQKAFVTGLPSLRRLELESACEDFSNIIGSLPGCALYKGTLSSGVEIAVTSSTITSAKGWLDQSEAQFRNKISVLSKLNHKNFMNLLGYCEEQEPFTRMMVYEYAPNGTLFEHLHIEEAEHLDWAARLRIIMGVAYCLDHMHNLNPPIILKTLSSSSIYLTDDYASKISDLSFWDEEKETEADADSEEGIVYKFGILLLEIISGRLPFSEDDGLLVLWASSHLTGKRPLNGMVDSTLKSFREEDVSALCEVIKSCINPEQKERPTMAEVTARLRQITGMPPDGATPKLSPLWWAELEIISTDGNSLQ